jgi:hypothetical protein
MMFSRTVLGLGSAVVIGACSSKSVERPAHYVPDDAAEQDSAGSDTGPASETGSPGERGRFILGDVVPCEVPAAGVRYTEVGQAMGLAPAQSDPGSHTEGGVAAVADLDGDGDLDIVLGYQMETPVLYSRQSEVFVPSALPTDTGSRGLTLVDVDGDGRLDIVSAGPAPAVFLNGTEGWTAEPLPDTPEALDGVGTVRYIAGDISGDGSPDLYALNTTSEPDSELAQDHVLINDGSGGFEAISDAVPEEFGLRHGFDARLFDWDDDGDLDVFVVNEFTEFRGLLPERYASGSFLLRNDGGTLVSANEECACELVVDGMGVDVGDINRDGLPDIFIGATNSTWLLQMLEDRSFVDVTLVQGADVISTTGPMGWGVRVLDFDNDGLQDLMVVEGDLWHEFTEIPWVLEEPIELMRQRSDGTGFERVSEEVGLGQLGSWRTIVAMDHNGDGVLDPLVTDVWRQPRLFMSEGCTANSWLEVEAPLSAKVELSHGGVTQTAWVTTHSSYGGSMAPIVHFGLGADVEVDALTVTMLDGERLTAPGPFLARRKVVLQ